MTNRGFKLIKARPAFLLLSAAIIPVLVLATLMGWFIMRERQAEIDADVRDRASLLASSLQRELATQIQLLSLVAESPRLDLPVSRTSFNETARRLNDQVPAWEQVRVSNGDGEIVLSFPPLAASAPRTVVDKESHDRVLKSGSGIIGNVVIGPGGKPAFAVRVPIIRSGRTRAILSAVIRPEIITQILQRSGLPNDWASWVVDNQDRIVAATAAPGFEARPALEYVSPAGDSRVKLHDGTSLQISEASLAGTPWRVSVGVPAADYDLPARQATLLLLVASIVLIALCATAAVLLYHELRTRSAERESLANWQRMDALGKLTGQAAHDFNNLLMVFQSGVEGIERRRNDEERVTRMLGHMKEGIARGKGITRRLLSFARRSNQGAEHIELDQKLEEIAPLLKQALNDTISLDIRLPDDLWSINADPVGLEIALINLLTNAREAMNGGGEVTVEARNIAEGALEDNRVQGPMVALTVSDRGAGIAAGDLARIFEPFFSKNATGRAGLGLTQVHGFATTSGGTVKAASLLGRGSAFTLLLPKSTAPRKMVHSEDRRHELPAKILLVDDTPPLLESARLTLEGLVPSILTARNGAEALEILKREPDIQAVVSDIMMPEVSGIELAEHLARSHPDLPVVLMTGYSDKLEAGGTISRPVLTKPFKLDDLLDALATAKSSVPDLTNVVRLDVSAKT
ncbi:response regulator [Rhizobium sp. Leaf321]|uniref:response regulator n=1 Tax=Rhizobium sp. Leaf321 TaxID=1736335 RepID=UPI001FCDB4FD|nr:response regulator [Rhizobium sp. Leaf321]